MHSPPRRYFFVDRAHAVVAGVVLDLGQSELLQNRRHIVGETTAQSLLESVPAPDRIVVGATPCFDGSLGGGLLLVGVAQRHPIAALGQHRVQIVDAPKVVAKLGLADLHDERGRIERLVAVGRELRTSTRRCERPRPIAGSVGQSRPAVMTRTGTSPQPSRPTPAELLAPILDVSQELHERGRGVSGFVPSFVSSDATCTKLTPSASRKLA